MINVNKSRVVLPVFFMVSMLFLLFHDWGVETLEIDYHAYAEEGGGDSKSEKERKIKYWVAPMDPTYIRDEPGKSPMGMDLIPVYEDDEEQTTEGAIRIDPSTIQNIGVRTQKAERGSVNTTIRTVGHVTYDEERVEHIHTKISGWVEKLYVDTTGEGVKKGQPLLSIYSPELVATQEEYIQALKYREMTGKSGFSEIAGGADSLIDSTRRRLLLMDIDHDQIKALEEKGKIQRNMILPSQASGIVIKKHVMEGMKVNPGMELYTLADLSRVWVMASVYEYELPFLKTGQEAEMTLSYDPGAKYHGRVTFIYPYLSSKTRTVQVRIEFDNPDMKLKPDMYTDIMIKAEIGKDSVVIPPESLIRTGTRNVVITSLGDGKFLPKEVEVGAESEELVQIVSGLDEGEIIVTSGQFLIDSESNLREAINKMLEAKRAAKREIPDQKDRRAGSTAKKDHEKKKKDDRNDRHRGHVMAVTDKQKALMSELIDHYIHIHHLLIYDTTAGVDIHAKEIFHMIQQLKNTSPEGQIKKIVKAMETSLTKLSSDNLDEAREGHVLLSRPVVKYAKEVMKNDLPLKGLYIYFCPMKEESWLQTGAAIKNPFFGREMLNCGIEEAD